MSSKNQTQKQHEIDGDTAISSPRSDNLPVWHYEAPRPDQRTYLPGESSESSPPLDGPYAMNLGNYVRNAVTNVDGPPLPTSMSNPASAWQCTPGRAYFDLGMRLMLSYQHEMAYKSFLACLKYSPDCAMAHGMVALCHSPNYNFRGEAYYESASHAADVNLPDWQCVFPSQQVAERHGKMGVDKSDALRKSSKKKINSKGRSYGRSSSSNSNSNQDSKKDETQSSYQPAKISEVESALLSAIRVLTCCPGVDAGLSEETVGRPYANALRKVHEEHPKDAEIAYFFAESLMVLNAWHLYEYPSGRPVSPDVVETRAVLETALQLHPEHAGLCHLYVHLSEMSAHPQLALTACQHLRHDFPHAGHLIHMPTHIDVLVGDYESCVRYNCHAVEADRHAMACSPSTAGKESFYFGYIVHDYHMAVYGCILGGYEAKAMEIAVELNQIVNERTFEEFPALAAYLETYAALEVHVMIRFGRWKQLLEIQMPNNKQLMLFRTASIKFGRAIALAATGHVVEALKEADRFDTLRTSHPQVEMRILHNNTVADLLAVDGVMLRGEIAYRLGRYDDAFKLLRKAVAMQDALNYDEPWGKMQPVRHALGGLLLEQSESEEAESVFREDLKFHPNNPWALAGLIRCLEVQQAHDCTINGDDNRCSSSTSSPCCSTASNTGVDAEIHRLKAALMVQRQCEWADYPVVVACECCQHTTPQHTVGSHVLE